MNSGILLTLYILDAIGIIFLCRQEMRKIQVSIFFLYGTAILAYPIVAGYLIQILGLSLSETNSVLLLWSPAVVLGLVNTFTTKIADARPGFILFLAPTFAALFNGLYTAQTARYPILFLLLTAPFFFSFSIKDLYVQMKNLVLFNAIAILGAHSLSLVLQSEPAIGACRVDKCTLFGVVLTPFGVQSNLTSIIYALIFPYLAFFLEGKRFLLITLLIMINANMCGGRTGLFAIAVLALVRILLHRRSSAKSRQLYLFMSLCIFMLSLIPVFKKYPNESFTGRGLLWNISREQIHQNFLFGSGPSFWVRLPEVTSLPAFYSSHNLWLELCVSTGVVATVFFAIALISNCWKAIRSNQEILLYVTYSFLLCGTFEAPIMPYRTVQAPGFYIFFLLVSSVILGAKLSKAVSSEYH